MPGLDATLGTIRRRLAGRDRRILAPEGFLPAAVAVPLVPTPEGLAVLFTVRTAHVEQHKGEISFPGGRVDPEDPDDLFTALRELWEEVGVGAAEVEVLGPLDDFVSITGYRVTPHVVYLPREDYPFVPQPREVAEILLVPLAHLLDRAHYHAVKPPGGPYHIHHFSWGPYVVWGLTAAILKRLLDLAFGFSEDP